MNSHRTIAIVCYAQAGKGKALRICYQLQQELENRSIPCTVYAQQWPPHFELFTDVFIVGGDGTLNYFINRYPNISIPLSIFKGGSGNDFAWKLYGNQSLTDQLETVLQAEAGPVDAGACNGHYFINGAGIGFDGEVVQAMGKKRFISAGHLTYLWNVFRKIIFYREKRLQLEYDGIMQQENFFLLTIANGSRYGGGFMVAPQAVVNDGWLDLITIGCINPWRRPFYLPKMEKGKHLNLPFVKAGKVKKITITSPVKVAGHIDGEFIWSTLFEIEILPAQFLFRY